MAIDSTRDAFELTAPAVGNRQAAIASIVFATTVFTSAFLLFLVQPLLGKYILPWFGGSPSVWTTCMLIFQALLFFGYAYAHLLSRLPLRWQATLHAVMLLTAVCTLPITPAASWKPTEVSDPASQIILLVLACVGLPYFLLSATGGRSCNRGSLGRNRELLLIDCMPCPTLVLYWPWSPIPS